MMKVWNSEGKPENFSDLVNPLVDAIKFSYKLERKNEDKDIPYEGFDIGDREQISNLSPDELLKAKSLEWSKDDQGRTALEEIIGIAFQLGIEQGRRIDKHR